MQLQTSSRQAYLDWLRIMAIIGILFFHSAMAFVADWGWHIKNKETSNLLLEFNFWLSRFRMPLLFFISGTVSYFMLTKKSGTGFVGLRFRRLFLPLLFGMLIIVPPQIYMERLTQGYHGSYTDFYPSVFTTGPYPKGNLSWHHLWFIAYLFIYDVACTPLFVWFMKKGTGFVNRLAWLANGKRIYLLMIPSVILYTSLTLKFPTTNDLVHDWCSFFYWLLFLLAGFICIVQPKFMDSLERNRRFSLTLAVLTILAINYVRWSQLEPWDVLANLQSDWRTYVFISLTAFTAWFWVFAGIGYGKKYLNKRHKVLDYVNQAVYPFYILHQTVIVVIVYYVVKTADSIGTKYIFTVITALILSMAIFHLLIRPFAITRFIFGMKPAKKLTESKQAVPNKERKETPATIIEPALQIS